MSLNHSEAAWTFPGIDGGTLLVALAVADRAKEETGICWPSVGYLATRTRLSVRQVQRCLRDLETAGFLSMEIRTGHSTLYRVLATPDTHVTPDVDDTPTPTSPSPDTHVTPGVTPMSPGGDTHVTQNHQGIGKRIVKESEGRARRFPDDFTLTELMAAKIREAGCRNPTAAFEQFRSHHIAKGSRMSSWPHAWGTWVSRHGVYSCPCQQAAKGKEATAAGGVRWKTAEETRAMIASGEVRR